MIRLLLFIFLLCVTRYVGIAKIRNDSFQDDQPCSQSKSAQEYGLDEHLAISAGIIENSASKSNFIPDVQKKKSERYDVPAQISISGYSPPFNLFYFIRKDNLFLSVLML